MHPVNQTPSEIRLPKSSCRDACESPSAACPQLSPKKPAKKTYEKFYALVHPHRCRRETRGLRNSGTDPGWRTMAWLRTLCLAPIWAPCLLVSGPAPHLVPGTDLGPLFASIRPGSSPSAWHEWHCTLCVNCFTQTSYLPCRASVAVCLGVPSSACTGPSGA